MGLRARGARAIATVGAGAAIALVVGAPAHAAAPDAEPGWAQRALDLQYELGSEVGFTNAPWVGTHNSFNSTEQTGVALSSNDSNQQITLVSQLDAGVRSLELDVHRFPDIPGTPGPIRVCHGRGADQGHFGCTTEKLLGPTLAEISAWLDSPAGEGQVLLLYLEDHMVDAAGYDGAAAIVTARLGDKLYAPPPSGCTEVPGGLTRAAVRGAGKQVVIVSDCGPGTGWAEVAFNWNSHVESRPVNYEDFPDCGPEYDRPTYDSKVVRYYEDSTALTNQVGPPTGVATPDDGITPPTAAAMARCGVDLIGLDQLTGPADPRLETLVWSWRANKPRPAGQGRRRRCAIQRQGVPVAEDLGGGERSAWVDRPCSRRNRASCRDGAGAWTIPRRAVPWRRAKAACANRGLVLGTPRTGFESQELGVALDAAGARKAWLGYRRRGGNDWQPTDPR